jgi:hypothetical protein
MTRFASTFFVVLFAAAAHAAPAPQPAASTASGQLQAAAGTDFAAVADGADVRPDGTRVVSVEKNKLIGTQHLPAHRECEPDADPMTDGRMIRNCRNEPASTETTYADREKIRIVDRDAYVDSQGSKWGDRGAWIGAGIGTLGFLALLAGPIGIFVGLGTMVVGAMVGDVTGAAVAKHDARNAPKEFTRDVNVRTVTSRP